MPNDGPKKPDGATLGPRRVGRLTSLFERLPPAVLFEDRDQRRFIAQTLTVASSSMALVSALGTIGVDTSPLLTGFGAFGVTLGFALRESVGNWLGGTLLLLYKPFGAGDVVVLQDGKYRGRVLSIDVRYVYLEVDTATDDKAIGEKEVIMIPASVLQTSTIRLVSKAKHKKKLL